MATVVSDLTPDQLIQFEQGCKAMLGFERSRLQPVLARHVRQGTSKYARSIPKEGIKSVTLSLSAALWISRAWVVTFVGLALALPTHGMTPAHISGLAIAACGVALFAVGFWRISSAFRSRSEFMKARSAPLR
jgi:hypothetical protein